MISKGHNFKNLTLVGIIDADMSLSGGDLRASEKAFQVLHQVSGRAGRENKKGIVLIANKWDLIEKNTNSTKEYEKIIKKEIEPFTDVKILFISTIKKQRIH